MPEHHPPREANVRQVWPWLVLAVSASAVPVILPVSAGGGHLGYQAILSFLGLFIGVAARPLYGVDAMVAWYLPMLVLVVAVLHRHLRRTRWVVAALLGVMTVVNLVVAIDEFPHAVTVADISAGSQPDFSGPGDFLPALLTTVAYGVAAVALVLGARNRGRRAGEESTSKMPRSR
ncbi:hypothetical protein [Microbispora sp. H10836]|uniref:hypothetical protein n=1 Tax=Microbispora sp. H10836 TaxID=2729106 RepID=UPI00147427B0|nr:hypothetical protein [Microbispora sp. H10836]